MAEYGAWQPWIDSVSSWLKEQHGASDDLADKGAVLMAYLTAYGLNPRVTSVFRDPAYQRQLQERYDAGDTTGLRTRPATNSKHSTTDWLGNPAASAIDIATDDDSRAAQIGAALGFRAGFYFKDPDPGHFDLG